MLSRLDLALTAVDFSLVSLIWIARRQPALLPLTLRSSPVLLSLHSVVMNRLFGASSSSKPKPNLQDAISSTDSRIDGIQARLRVLYAACRADRSPLPQCLGESQEA